MGKIWGWLSTPSARSAAGVLVGAGAIIGVVAAAGFATFLHYTNTYEFCIGCHEMSWADAEYRESTHFSNASGVRATCPDCHVPHEFFPKLKRKILASLNDIPAKIAGTISTQEKFEAKRLEMARNVWAIMKANNSHECRNCHDAAAMALADQRQRAKVQHEDARTSGETCIDCHKGIAHHAPEGELKEEEKKEEKEAEGGGFTI